MRILSFVKNKPAFAFLLPFFFIFHGFVAHYDFIPAGDALVLFSLYLGGMLILVTISWLFFRNIIKAAVISFYVGAIFFFFGGIQDVLRNYFAGSFFSRYSLILPLFLVLFVLLIRWIRKTRSPLLRLTLYLNILFLVLCGIDLIWLGGRIFSMSKASRNNLSTMNLSVCDSCKKPNIFFIVLDGYPGNTALNELFHFDNGDFEQQLEQRGFYVVKRSRSNYNYTPFSIASTLNMKYLDLDMDKKAPGNIDYCYGQIKNSSVVRILQANGYTFYNYSIFDFKDRPAVSYDNFIPGNTSLITSQTFASRLLKDISYNISTGKWKLRWGLEKRTYEHLRNNENIIMSVKKEAAEKTNAPKFIYAHLMMPHYPYYFNSKGQPLPIDSLLPGKEMNRGNYIEYLQYCNQQILDLVEHITANSQSPIIMLLGDHGFRQGISKQERKYIFMNLSAIYLPRKNYTGFSDSTSNVNQFRLLFNAELGQHLPLLKDSTVFLWND